MNQFKFENITINYVQKSYDSINQDNELPSVGSMLLYDIDGDVKWLEDDKYLSNLAGNITTNNPFEIINLFEKLLNEYCNNEYVIYVECTHPMWIYHDLLHAEGGDIFPGNNEYINSIEPLRIKQQFEWCIENKILVERKHLFMMLLEDNSNIDLIDEYFEQLTNSTYES